MGGFEEVTTISETPLNTVDGWSDEHIGRLGEVWITSAEQVVALGATQGGMTSLADQLGVTEDKARDLVDQARIALPPQVRDEMETPVDTGEYGTGVLPPRRDGGPD